MVKAIPYLLVKNSKKAIEIYKDLFDAKVIEHQPLSKEVGKEYVQIAMDFEHMLSIKLDVDKVIECLPPDGGDYVRVIHLGYPSPMTPAHIPIPAGSNEQVVIYKWLYNLRQKGFKEAFWIFERGGGKDPIQKSVSIMRWTKEYLEKLQ